MLIVYAAATIIITSLSFFSLKNDSRILIDIVNNWHTGAIIDIKVANVCPGDYEEAFNYTWPGTTSGCFCGNISLISKLYFNLHHDMYVGFCSFDKSWAGCRDAYSANSKLVDVWSRVNNTDMRLCVRRSQDSWANMAGKSGESCQDNTLKKCGISADLTFCTTEAQCPINDIQVRSLTLPADDAELWSCTPDSNCQVMAEDSSSAKILQYQRGDTFDALPTAQFSINEYGMCKDMTKNDITPGREEFDLLNQKRSTCNKDGSSRWNTSDSMTEAQLFDLNGLANTINRLLPFKYYPFGQNGSKYQWSMFSRSYIPWNIDCRSDMSSVIAKSSSIQDLRSFHLVLFIITVIAGVFFGLVFPILLYRSMVSGRQITYCGKVFKKEDFRRCCTIISFGFKFAVALFIIIAFIKDKASRDLLTDVAASNCSNSDIMGTFIDSSKDLHRAYAFDIVLIVLWSVLVVASLYCLRGFARAEDEVRLLSQNNANREHGRGTINYEMSAAPAYGSNNAPPLQGQQNNENL